MIWPYNQKKGFRKNIVKEFDKNSGLKVSRVNRKGSAIEVEIKGTEKYAYVMNMMNKEVFMRKISDLKEGLDR